MAMILPRDAYVRFNSSRLSDHNREPVEQTYERIESRVRTARGRMRKSYVADKRSFSLSWSELPENTSDTIDGYWGAGAIILFYRLVPGEFEFSLTRQNGSQESCMVVFSSLSHSVVHRYDRYYYDISLTLEEV